MFFLVLNLEVSHKLCDSMEYSTPDGFGRYNLIQVSVVTLLRVRTDLRIK